MFKIISICSGGGYKYCRTYPKHPNANSNGLYPLHRVLMENKLNRLLLRKEIVHHKNENKDDNSIKNLELLSASDHAKEHKKKIALLKICCPECKKIFYLKPHSYRLRLKRSKYNKLFCSYSCGAINQHKNTAE